MTDPAPFNPYSRLPQKPSFELRSTDVEDGEPLPPAQYAASVGGGDTSPQLAWSAFPAETQSFAVTAYDPDAPTGAGFWHWAVFNIPASVTSLPTGAGAAGGAALPAGAVMLPNDMRAPQFAGAAPPEGTGVHHYYLVVHAVDVPTLDIPAEATPTVLGFTLNFHTLARAMIVPTGEFGGQEA